VGQASGLPNEKSALDGQASGLLYASPAARNPQPGHVDGLIASGFVFEKPEALLLMAAQLSHRSR
jgi:hypothetical protein